MAKILLAEDDRDLSDVISFVLKTNGHIIKQVYDGRQCLDHLRSSKYDVIILDWMMPWISGLEVCKTFRLEGGVTPILLLTAKTQVDDRETGLDSGADDYLTKPFDQRELAARVRALLRRPDKVLSNSINIEDIVIDNVTCKVIKSGKEIHLRPKEFSLLEFFMRHPNQTFTSDALLQRVWLDESAASVDNLKTHVKMLRKKIGEGKNGPFIQTIRGRGYLFNAPED